MKKFSKFLTLIVIAVVLCFSTVFSSSAADEDGKWIAGWGTGPTNVSLGENIALFAEDMTIRSVITTSASGSKIRIKFSNYYGKSDLTLNQVTIAKAMSQNTVDPNDVTSAIDPSTLKAVTFDGSPFVTIPAGKEIYSDPISLQVAAMENLSVSFYIKDMSEIRTMGLSGGTTFISTGGDKTQIPTYGLMEYLVEEKDVYELISAIFPTMGLDLKMAYKMIRVVPCLSTVDVLSDKDAYTVAIAGDSTVANEFPYYLAKQIHSFGVNNVGVMGKGLIGNMLSCEENSVAKNIFGDPLTKRFINDIADQANVKYVIIKIGANDIIHPVSGDNLGLATQPGADDIIAAIKDICDKVHKMGAKAIVSTITQWKGTKRDYLGTGANYIRTTAEEEADWQIAVKVNNWITSNKNTFHDGYVDLAKISGPEQGDPLFGFIYEKYTDDNINPNDDLQRLWAEKFPLSLIGVDQRVGNIRLSVDNKSIYVTGDKGESFTLNVTEILPSNSANKTVSWSVSDSSILDIKPNGNSVVVTAKKPGTASVICSSTDGGNVTAECKVTVKTHVSSVTLNKSTASVYTRKTVKLNATILPKTADNRKVTWKSSNSKVATVDSNGLVTGVGAGSAVISCIADDNKLTAKCTVTVNKPVDVIFVDTNVSEKTLKKGATYQLKTEFTPENATFKDVKWKSDNTKVATVSSKGVVKAVKPGTAYITCTSVDNPMVMTTVKITVVVKVTGVKLDYTQYEMYATTEKALNAKIYPSSATNKNLKWTSSKKSVATVDKKGNVKALKPGKTTITVKTKDGGYKASCVITVKKIVPTKSISFAKANYTVSDGKTLTLKPQYNPSNASVRTCEWTSSNSKVASVSDKGVIKAKKPGTVTITCKTTDTGKVATCTVTVKKATVKSVSLDKSKISLLAGGTMTLEASINPSNATNKDVKWTSSNKKVATVNSKGKVTAKSRGTATITCTTVDGEKKATCKVTVVAKKIEKIKLDRTSIKIGYSTTTTLKASVSPKGADKSLVKWSSSNTKVAKVDKNGKVTAVGEGVAVITCKPADGSRAKAATCKVEVFKTNVIGIKLSHTGLTMDKGLTFQLTGLVLPASASDKRVLWTTSDVNVASVSSTGLVTARGSGKCLIKATAIDGGYVAVCEVTVR